MKNLLNPFIAGQPVFGNNFIDRLDALKRIDSFLKSRKHYTFTFLGQRRIGKTSMLRHIEFLYKNNVDFCITYLNIQNYLEANINDFLIFLKETICQTKLTEILKEQDFFVFVEEQLSNKPQTTVLLFDEFDSVYHFENNNKAAINAFYNFFYNFSRSIAEKHLKIKLIFAIAPSFRKKEDTYYYEILKYGKSYNLNFFHPIKTTELLKKSEPYVYFTEKARKYIFFMSAGHPLFTQCIASSAFKFAVGSGINQIDYKDIKKILPATFKAFDSNLFWIWNSLHNWQKLLITFLIESKAQKQNTDFYSIMSYFRKNKIHLSDKELSDMIDLMIRYKYIKQIKGQYYIKAKFFGLWLRNKEKMSK